MSTLSFLQTLKEEIVKQHARIERAKEERLKRAEALCAYCVEEASDDWKRGHRWDRGPGFQYSAFEDKLQSWEISKNNWELELQQLLDLEERVKNATRI